jgi:single-strand DNA-binding protein
MRGINKVILVGNSGKETDFKTLQDGTPVAKLAIATTETLRLKNGETSTTTEWHPVILWRGLSTLAHQYIHKGSLIYIEGKLRHRQYEDKDGQKKYITEVVANQIVLLDKKMKSTDQEADHIPRRADSFLNC